VDLFEPGSGSQVHDFNGGIQPSGLFWIVEIDDDELRVSRDGRRAELRLNRESVVDSFTFGGPSPVPATVSMNVKWEATGPFVSHGSGDAVSAADPAAFLGRFAKARSTGTFSGSELGFSFGSKGVATAGHTFAELGQERNGAFL
jgi:hypothetical protein